MLGDSNAFTGSNTFAGASTFNGASTFTVNPIITNASPGLIFTDTTALAKSMTILVDGNLVNFRESAGASGSLLTLDLANNRVGIGTATPDTALHVAVTNATSVIHLERNDTTIGTDDIVGRLEIEGQDAGASGICAKLEAIGEGNDGETGWRFSNGIAGAVTETMRLTYLGYLGIGVTEPDAKLHVQDVTGAVQRMTRQATTVTDDDIIGRIEFETQDSSSAGVGAVIQAEAEGSSGEVGLSFQTGTGGSATEKFRINNTGVVMSPNDLHFNCTAAKTIVLDIPVYQDANVGALVLRTGGTAPGVVQIVDEAGANTGIYAVGFAEGEQGSGAIEIPHDYKQGTDLIFHVHWGANDAPTDTDQVEWELTYTLSREGTTLNPVAVITTNDIAYDTQYEWMRSDFPTITGTNFLIGDQFLFTLKRIAAAGDAFAGETLVATIGFHYQVDTLGSRAVGTK
jgi:hypothetical protein